MVSIPYAQGSEEFLEAVVAPGRGWIPNLFKALAHNEELTKAWARLGNAVRDHALEPRSRELVILLVSHIKQSEYEWVHHLQAGSRAGIEASEVDDLLAWPARGAWSPTDWAMLNTVAAVASHEAVPEWAATEVRAACGDKAFVDLCVTSAYYVSVAHLIAALGVELEPAREHDRDR
jgi:AhpD family alkylhydroperoxidase